MLNSRPDTGRLARRLAVVLATLSGMAGAFASPDSSPNAVARTEPEAASLGYRVPAGTDPMLRWALDQASTALPAARRPEATEPVAADSPFVDRVRDSASGMVLTAMNFLGVPYRRGGEDADHGFDCSGFTRHIFERSLGLVLPRRADGQAKTAGLLHIDREQLKPGDLVFFNTMRRTFSHVGIYVGAGKFIHSPKPGGEVRVDDLHAAYWEKRFTGGRRAEAAGETAIVVEPDPAAAATVN